MGKIEKFEDLIAWQKARMLAKDIYRITREQRFAKDTDLIRQIRRAAVSVMSNIAEGYERAGCAEFHHFLLTAKASCAEVRSHLYIACDVGYLDDSTFQDLLRKAEELGRIIGGLRLAVQRRRS